MKVTIPAKDAKGLIERAERRGYLRGIEDAAKVAEDAIKRNEEQRDAEILGTIDRDVIGRGIFILKNVVKDIRALAKEPTT